MYMIRIMQFVKGLQLTSSFLLKKISTIPSVRNKFRKIFKKGGVELPLTPNKVDRNGGNFPFTKDSNHTRIIFSIMRKKPRCC
ncbi:hypothetical protein AI28_23150 [bacteria symbiont BFo1 of Frankliniella occidentalis]|nr:hypothetical protein AI28_23150 [bacteria symbiont BFo1 of Frankliniella occidentalis]